MNKVKLLIATIVAAICVPASAFNIVNHSDLYTPAQCTGDYNTVRAYSWVIFQPRDEFTSSTFVQLQPVTSATITDPAQTTKIGIYNSWSMLNCGDMNNWIYPSVAVPADKTVPAIHTVVSIAKWPSDSCRVVSTPASRDEIIAQFVFINAYREVTSWLGVGTSWTVGVTLPVGSGTILPMPTNYTIIPDYNLSNTVKFEKPECLNIQAAWCGDGVLDAGYETCDPSDPSRTGWGSGGCNASCAPVTASCAVGTTTGSQSAPLTAISAGLCASGSSAVSSFSGVTSGNTTTYSWACNGISGGSCTASYTPSGGGGGGSSCNAGTTTGVQSTPLTATSTGLCALGSGSVGNFSSSVNGTTIFYSWSCDGVSGGSCSASYTTSGGWWGGGWGWWGGGSGGSGWWGGWSSVPTGGTVTVPGSSAYCGNGVVERPNASGQRESCDTNAPWCVGCMIASTNPGGTTGPGNLAVTNPGWGGTLALSSYKLIVGDGVPLFSDRDIVFSSDYPLYLEGKTATVTNNSPLIAGSTITKTVNNIGVGGEVRFENRRIYAANGSLQSIVYDRVVYPQNAVIFDRRELVGFQGDTSSFEDNSAVAYRDTPKTSTPSAAVGAFYTSLQFLESAISVRVAKSLVSNVAGGNAYVSAPVGYDVNVMTANFLNDLKTGNFTSTTVNAGSWRGGRNLSSATKSIVANESVNAIISSGSSRESLRVKSSATVGTRTVMRTVDILSLSDLLAKTDAFSESENVRVLRGAHLRIGKTMVLSGIRTIIVEDGDLIIDQDLTYADKKASYAFIVKKGDIVIANTVRKLSGAYVTLTGLIRSDGVSTTNILTVDGSLYGNDFADLSAHRTYVRGDAGSTALSVGVVVNYSNRALSNPPPLLSEFLEQYSLKRIAK